MSKSFHRPAAMVCALLLAAAGRAQTSSAPPPAGLSAQHGELEAAAQEFKLATAALGLRADSPRKTASGVKLSSYHGRLYENFRNDFLDAVPHEIAQNGGTKGLLRRNQYGFNVSGPVFLPHIYNGARRTFFSLNFEGVQEHIGRSYLRTVPIAAQRTGDYSSVVDAGGAPLQIYDPLTTQPNPGYDSTEPVTTSNLQYDRAPFPNSLIPASRLDPVAQKIVSYIPLPNTDVGPYFQNNYFVVSPETNTASGMIAKIDHSFDDRRRLSVSTSYTNGFDAAAHYIDNAADPGAPDRNYSNRRVSAEYDLTLSPGSVNAATVDMSTNVSSNSSAAFDPATALGLAGLTAQVFPRIGFGYLPVGRYSPNSRLARNFFTYADAQSLKLGRHSLRFSGQFQRQQVDTFQPSSPAGDFYTSAGYTDLPGIVDTGSQFASLLLGAIDSGDVSDILSPSYFRISNYALVATDTWEPAPGLTFHFALTVEMQSPRIEKYDRQSTVDLNAINPADGLPGALIFAGLNGAPAVFQPFLARGDPSVSVAWSPGANRKSVIRASYARFYQMPPLYGSQWGTQGFNGVQTFTAPDSELTPAFFLAGGVPSPGPLPDLSADAAYGTNAAIFDRSGTTAMYESAGLSYEREVPFQVVLSTGLGTAWGHHLYVGNWAANPNAISPDALQYGVLLNDTAFRNSLRPYPQYLDFDVNGLWPAGDYRRNNAWLRVEKRASGGLTVSATYEFSRQWDDYSGPYGKQDYFNPRNEWALTPWNPPNRLSLNLSYDLPFGAGKPFLNFRDWRRHLVDGWSVSDISIVQDGGPIALEALFNNTGGVINALRVDTVPGVNPNLPDQSPQLWFNPAAFIQPPDFTLGDASRTISILNPGIQNHDLSLAKRFALDADRTVEFTASAFDFLNHANWNNPDPVIGSLASPNTDAGHIIGSRGGRVVQLGLRLSF
ncbi:MAG: hypothetical protein ACLQBJ_02465 [Bryobacteraceae bacterium]